MPDHRYYVLVKWGKRQMANSSAESWDPDDGSGTFGGVMLCPDTITAPTKDDVTHTACNTIAPEEWRSGILNAYDNVPFVEVYRVKTPYPEPNTVQRYVNGGWQGVDTGRIEDVALQDQNLQKIRNDI